MSVYLNVPYRDKDVVKALGAKWDFNAKKWYVPDGVGQDAFKRWIAAGSAGAGAGAPSEVAAAASGQAAQAAAAGEPAAKKLSQLLNEVSDAVRRSCPYSYWITAEIASLRRHGSGHTYFELVEHDEFGKETAKAFAKIWASQQGLLRKFESATGSPLAAGMKVMVSASVEFSGQYGFSLNIQDINPSWTLGEMEAKKAQIRKRLAEEGLWDLNRQLAAPGEFLKVLVLSPSLAAGLGDFKSEADKLGAAGLCRFDYFEATFEGVNACESICRSLDSLLAKGGLSEYDAMVFIRGGGAVTSLNWLNEYEIAKRICAFPIPVICGIGHERDSTVIDEICCVKKDTPSKCAEHIKAAIVQNAMDAAAHWSEFAALCAALVESCELKIERQMNAFGSVSSSMLAQHLRRAESLAAEAMGLASQKAEQALRECEHLMRQAVGLGPQNILERGYCAAQSAGGGAISSRAMAPAGLHVKLVWKDGSRMARIDPELGAGEGG